MIWLSNNSKFEQLFGKLFFNKGFEKYMLEQFLEYIKQLNLFPQHEMQSFIITFGRFTFNIKCSLLINGHLLKYVSRFSS
jgi:hypothetical protein